jgi:trans-2,3-dihydro-3-hydroxyanthranilate isomerase
MNDRRSFRYRVVDVFTTKPLEGNPLAVFPEARDLDEVTMQSIARELNLAETAFVVPPRREGCIAGVKIFTPRKEMAFAGHPTVGTSFVSSTKRSAPFRFVSKPVSGP